jgi:hydroxymethylpyrimidine/phosphomethylpyrimidine kinase
MTMVQTKHYPRVLSIAGSDSGGGAGIQADLKTFSALGCFGMTAITALTAQNTLGVHGIYAPPVSFLKDQLRAVLDDMGVDAVKIGMLHSPEVVEVVAWAIETYQIQKVVLDTVMVATSGDALMLPQTVQRMVQVLFPLACVVTPNLDEANALLQRQIASSDEFVPAAQDLLAMGARAVLLKGGHLMGDQVVDVLVQPEQAPMRLSSARIASRNVHGTGCTLSSAIAAHLALGHDLQVAVRLARQYIVGAITQGATVMTGQGHGPLNHGFAPMPMRVIQSR